MNQTEDVAKKNPMRRLLSNLGFLVRGRGIAAVMLLGTAAIMARALGAVEFGMIALIQTYVLLIRGLLNFKQFEAIVRFGLPAFDAGDNNTLRRLIVICRRVDTRMSIAATITALALAPVLGPWMGMDQQHVILLAVYSLVLLTTGNRTDIGILRLFDQFGILGRQMTIGPVIRFFSVLVAWHLDAPLFVYVAILTVTFIIEELYLSWCGRREFGLRIGMPTNGETFKNAQMSEFKGLRHFLWITYWQANVDLIPKHLSIMLAGLLIGSSEAGLLRLARQLSSVLAKPAVLIRQVVFLDLTRSWHQGDKNFKLIAYQTALFGGLAGAVFVVASYFWGDNFLSTLVGPEFVPAAPVLTLLLLAGTFDLIASSLRSGTYAIGLAGRVLHIYIFSAVVYLSLFALLSLNMGLIGTGVAAAIGSLIPPLIMLFMIHKSLP